MNMYQWKPVLILRWLVLVLFLYLFWRMKCWACWCSCLRWRWCLSCTSVRSAGQTGCSCSLRRCSSRHVHPILWLSDGRIWPQESVPTTLWLHRPHMKVPLSHCLGHRALKRREEPLIFLFDCIFRSPLLAAILLLPGVPVRISFTVFLFYPKSMTLPHATRKNIHNIHTTFNITHR